jgi:hypothetical protein
MAVAGHAGPVDPADRLDAVHIKVTLGAARIDETIRILALTMPGLHRRIYFCEQPAGDHQPCVLPLADSGVTLRLRQTAGRGDQSTVKLRPCRRSRLTAGWLAFRRHGPDELRIEADWAGDRKVLAASLTSDLGRSKISAVLAGHLPLRQLFSSAQRRFLTECADTHAEPDALQILGPVHAMRWPPTRWQALDVTAERWQLTSTTREPLNFLELSLRVEPQGAEIAQRSLDACLSRNGLDPDTIEGTKTHHVLKRLADQATQPP